MKQEDKAWNQTKGRRKDHSEMRWCEMLGGAAW